ncbi:MAG: hypothetical protein ACLT8I_19250 [Blautia faecis]
MADQAINALSTKTAPETSDQLLLVGAGEPQLIDYDKLADAILNKITSKNYALDAGQMTLLAALNKLNSETIKTDNNFTGNVDNVRNSVVWCNTALNAPSNIGLLVSFSTFNIGQIFVDYTQFLIYIRWLNGNTNKWSEWSAI